ncbi:hypothetical protein TNCV_1826041 [Trichonephila clavipes]|nr:hypothetical protein TNCV_1826041 [Trichonephila clavipes]
MEPEQDGSADCLRTHWTSEKTSPITMVRSQLSMPLQHDSLLAHAKVIFFIDSQAAISALSSKQGAESSQLEVPLALRSAKSLDLKRQEPWKAMGNPGYCGCYAEASGEVCG